MIRLSPNQRPEAWHDIEIDIDGETAAMRVRYWLLDKREAADWTSRRIALAKAVRSENEVETFERLLQDMSEEQMQRADSLLRERIVDWDLVDADSEEGAKLAITAQNIALLLNQTRFWKPMLQGLIDASSGIALKKTASTGSDGGQTMNRRD